MKSENHNIDVSIIIPCYMEEGHIWGNAKEICRVMQGTKYKFELIFVDDKSTDNTREKILEIEKSFPDVRYLFHEKNTGKGGAITGGVKIARGKFIGHLDIDLEVSAEYLPEVLSEMEKDSDIVLIKRKVNFSPNPNHLLRDVAGKIHRLLVNKLLHIPHTDVQSGCKFFRRDAILFLLNKTESQSWFFDVEIMAHAYYRNYRIKQLTGLYVRSKKKKSTVKLLRDGLKMFSELIKFRKNAAINFF